MWHATTSTPIEDILADYIENDSTVSARSLVARLHLAGESPPDPPLSPPDLNYDDSTDEEDDQLGPANDEYYSNAVSPTLPEATEHEPEAVLTVPPTCAFPGCPRPPYVDPIGVTHQCCGRTCAGALLVLNAQGQTSVGVVVPEIVIAETISPDPGASSAPASAPSGWFPQPPFPQAPILYGNGDYTELEEYGGSGLDTGDEGDESTAGL